MAESSSATSLIISPNNVTDLYGDLNLSDSQLFAGGYTNFGYWQGIDISKKISINNRILSSKNLYINILNSLDIGPEDIVLEVGCGLGNGVILANQMYSPRLSIGVDSSIRQVERAFNRHQAELRNNEDAIQFQCMNAEKLLFPKKSISRMLSIEALQHFDNVSDFIASASLVLKKNGKISVATFFFTRTPDTLFFSQFPTFANGVDKVVMLDDLIQTLSDFQFQKINVTDIGDEVWSGFNQWILQTDYKETWDAHWIDAYKEGLLSYFVIEAEKG